jgi:hypothetical protein
VSPALVLDQPHAPTGTNSVAYDLSSLISCVVLSSNERRVLNSFIGSECTILDLTDALLDYQVRLGSVEITCVRPGKLHGRAKDSMLPLADLTPLFFL